MECQVLILYGCLLYCRWLQNQQFISIECCLNVLIGFNNQALSMHYIICGPLLGMITRPPSSSINFQKAIQCLHGNQYRERLSKTESSSTCVIRLQYAILFNTFLVSSNKTISMALGYNFPPATSLMMQLLDNCQK